MTNPQLHTAQLKILKLTPDKDGLSASDICKGSGFATFAALNRLSQLDALGMVERIPTEGASLWRRTEAGRDQCRRMEASAAAALAILDRAPDAPPEPGDEILDEVPGHRLG